MERKDFDDLRRQFESVQGKQIVATAIFVVAVVLLGWAAFTCFYTVQTDEVGVVLRFGRDTRANAQPGLHFKLPFGVDRVIPVKVDRVHKLEFGYRTASTPARGRSRYQGGDKGTLLMLTGDLNVVSVEWIVQYKIKDASDYLFNIRDPEETIRDLSESTMRLVIGDASATEALTERRELIADEVATRLQDKLDSYGSGIDIQTVELQNVVPPTKAVKDAFNDVNSAKQDQETKKNEARRAFQKAIPLAQGEARRLVAQAEGYKLKRVNEARGDAARFLALAEEYGRSKEVTRTRLYLEAIEEVLPRLMHVYVVDPDTGGPLQVLDLNKLKR